MDDDYGNTGIGEAGPLKLLSVDDVPHFEDVINHVCSQVDLLKSYSDIHELVPKEYPSIVFALE
ncbi:hypothetical protein, partial [Salmonella enterica]|uniref:hypothetical protein n=1 Tax=Salmonella enterica TaxID=28901 RepID=UPI001C6E1B63